MTNFYPEVLKNRYSEATILFIRTIAHRVYRRNKNALIITSGPSGSGKSYVDLELLRGIHAYVHGEFPSDKEVVDRCFFKLKEFLQILNSPLIKDSKTSRGQIFISEEVGTQANNRSFQNIANRAYSFIVQTFRAKGMIVFFNVPSFTFIDSQVRKQLHYLLETKMIDTNLKACIIKPLELQYNSRMDKIYFHNIKAQTSEREIVEMDLIDIPKIPNTLAKLYEEKKAQFINDLNESLQNALDKMEGKDINVYINGAIRKPLTKKQKLVMTMLANEIEEPKNSVVAKKLGIGNGTLSEHKKAAEKKGYHVEEFKNEIPEIENLTVKSFKN